MASPSCWPMRWDGYVGGDMLLQAVLAAIVGARPVMARGRSTICWLERARGGHRQAWPRSAPRACSHLLPPCPQASLDDLNRQLAFAGEAGLPMNRFRPNLVVRGARAWAEDGWRRLAVGAGAGAVEF